jgi:hypothetical protein
MSPSPAFIRYGHRACLEAPQVKSTTGMNPDAWPLNINARRENREGIAPVPMKITEIGAMPDGPRCDPFGAQPPAASSCQHRIAIAGDA